MLPPSLWRHVNVSGSCSLELFQLHIHVSCRLDGFIHSFNYLIDCSTKVESCTTPKLNVCNYYNEVCHGNSIVLVSTDRWLYSCVRVAEVAVFNIRKWPLESVCTTEGFRVCAHLVQVLVVGKYHRLWLLNEHVCGM